MPDASTKKRAKEKADTKRVARPQDRNRQASDAGSYQTDHDPRFYTPPSPRWRRTGETMMKYAVKEHET